MIRSLPSKPQAAREDVGFDFPPHYDHPVTIDYRQHGSGISEPLVANPECDGVKIGEGMLVLTSLDRGHRALPNDSGIEPGHWPVPILPQPSTFASVFVLWVPI